MLSEPLATSVVMSRVKFEKYRRVFEVNKFGLNGKMPQVGIFSGGSYYKNNQHKINNFLSDYSQNLNKINENMIRRSLKTMELPIPATVVKESLKHMNLTLKDGRSEKHENK